MRKRYPKRAPKKSSAPPIKSSAPDAPKSIPLQHNNLLRRNCASRGNSTRLALFFGRKQLRLRRSCFDNFANSIRPKRSHFLWLCFLPELLLDAPSLPPNLGYMSHVTLDTCPPLAILFLASPQPQTRFKSRLMRRPKSASYSRRRGRRGHARMSPTLATPSGFRSVYDGQSRRGFAATYHRAF